MPTVIPKGLSEAQVDHFIEQRFVRLDSACGPDLARQGQDELWAAMGPSPDKPETWTQPVVLLGWMASPPFVAAANTPRSHMAYDAPVGEGCWIRPEGLGTVPIRFPSFQAPGDDGWHVDVSFGTDNTDFLEWRVNVRSTGRALSSSTPPNRTGPHGPASWRSRRSDPQASLTQLCHRRRFRGPFGRPAG